MRDILRAMLAMAVLGVTSLADAEPAEAVRQESPGGGDSPRPDVPDGLFVHVGSGLGAISISGFPCTSTPCGAVSGAAATHSIAVGRVVGRHLALGVGAWDAFAVYGGNGPSRVTEPAMLGLGPNVTFRLPANVHVSASPSVALPSVGSFTAPAFAVRAALGKEWAAKRRWGLGVELEYVRVSQSQHGHTLTANTLAIGFSATRR